MEDSIETEDGGGTRVAMNTKTLLRFIIQQDTTTREEADHLANW